jgi:hypothetical protein
LGNEGQAYSNCHTSLTGQYAKIKVNWRLVWLALLDGGKQKLDYWPGKKNSMISFMSLSLIKLTMAQTYFINAWRSEDCVGPPQIFMRVELRETRNQSYIATYYHERVGADHCGQSAVPYVNPKRCYTTITKMALTWRHTKAH